jgi:hypothetical protein
MSEVFTTCITPLWGVFIFGVMRFGRRTAPWLQRERYFCNTYFVK